MKTLRICAGLFWDFLRIGMFTFGGGWSIVAQMQKLYVEKRAWITNEELLDLTSVGRSLPGIMILNAAMLFGHRRGGYLAGLACVIGVSFAPFVILSVITLFYAAFRTSKLVAAAMTGLRASVVPIIAYAAISVTKSSIRDLPSVVVLLLAFTAYFFLKLSCIWVIVLGIVCGFVITEARERKDRRDGGAV